MIEAWRRLALIILFVGCAGTAAELVLLEHYEDPWQWTPIGLLALGLVWGGVSLWRPSRRGVRGMQAIMSAFIVAGGLGVYLHLKANLEFELELRPSMAGTELAVETLRGAMPALAPGTMFWLGLVGFLACFRHPALGGGPVSDSHHQVEVGP